ncbi:MAG: hypothetical protein IIW48_13630 [Clostridia bacterium]|nr:hypothetical protein [Clostridia bacterium]
MNIKKFIAVMVAAAMCFSLSVTAFAVNGGNEPSQENTTAQSPSEESTSEAVSEESPSEEYTSEAVSEESPSEESTSEAVTEEPSSEEQSSQAPDEDDVIALIISLLSKIDLNEVKDALNDINEALGLPRVESFTDIPAYADAIYEKLEEMGLGYADIINGLASSDLLDWLNNLIFGGNSSKPVTTVPAESETNVENNESVENGEGNENNENVENDGNNENGENDAESIIPDTGASFGVTAVALAALGGSGALALILRKRISK